MAGDSSTSRIPESEQSSSHSLEADGPTADTQRETLLEDARSYFESPDVDVAPAPSDDALETGFYDFDPLARDAPVEGYWVNEPFVYVSIQYDDAEDAYRYQFVEPVLDRTEQRIRDTIETRMRKTLLDEEFERTQEGERRFEARIRDTLAEYRDAIDPAARWKLYYYLTRNFVRYGRLDPLMQDPNIEDISCNGADVPVYLYHRDYGNIESRLSFDRETLDSFAMKLAQRSGRHLSAARPLVTTTLPDGSRLQVTLDSDVVTRGGNFTIRKFREEPFTPVDLLSLGTFSLEQVAYLWLAIKHNKSILFVGPTASGKTTSMNATSLFIPPGAKVVSIEETREINLPHDNWIADVTRETGPHEEQREISMYPLLDEALHQRSDYLLVGEIRTDPDVVLAFFQAIGTGHEGFTTFHAESSRDAIRRLSHNPLNVPAELIGDLDIISVQHLLESQGANVRRCRQLTEVQSPGSTEQERPELRDVFEYDPQSDDFVQASDTHLLAEIADQQGWSRDRLQTEFRRRQIVLAHLLENEITDYEEVATTLFRFARNPERVIDEIDASALPELTPIDIAAE